MYAVWLENLESSHHIIRLRLKNNFKMDKVVIKISD
jgi:hypothetical protein